MEVNTLRFRVIPSGAHGLGRGLADKREAAIRRYCGVSADDAGALFALRSARRRPGRRNEKGVAEATPPRVPPLPQSMLRST